MVIVCGWEASRSGNSSSAERSPLPMQARFTQDDVGICWGPGDIESSCSTSFWLKYVGSAAL